MPDWSRRSFLIKSGSVAAASVVAGVAGRRLLEGARSDAVDGRRDDPAGGRGRDAAGRARRSTSPASPRSSSRTTDFYRIDTALLTPSVDVASWSLRVHGLVDRETSLTYAELVELPLIEQYVTIACVSNEVGGNLVGNAKWTGVRLRDVLEMAGVQSSATQLVGRSVDGWTAGHADELGHGPGSRADDRREDERRGPAADPRLPGAADRARPVRLRVGDEVALGPRADDVGIVRRLLGPARLGQGRTDPDPGPDRRCRGRRQSVPAGRVAIAGVAWAPDRGISKVEVAIDGEWRDCTLCPTDLRRDVDPVDVRLGRVGRARATTRSRSGRPTATARSRRRPTSPPAPDGARGHHTITVRVASRQTPRRDTG